MLIYVGVKFMKNASKLFAIGILTMFLFGTTIPVFGVNSEQNEIIVLEYSFSSPVIEKTAIRNEIYDRIRVDGLFNTNDLGIPRLPVKPVKILLPQGRDVKEIRLITSGEKNFGTDFKIEVGGKLVPLFVTKVTVNTESVSSKIPTRKFSTSLFENKGVYNSRGFDILHVNLFPVQYCTDTGELSYFENMKIAIETKESTINRAFRGLDEDYLAVQNIVDNPDCIGTYKQSLLTPTFLEQYDYVVITNQNLKNSNGDYTFQDLLDYKESKGLTTNIVTVEDIVDNPEYGVFGTWGDANTDNPFYESEITGNLEYFDDAPARIRNFIRFAYSEWGTSYILLGGDADVIVPDDNIIPLRGLFANESGLPLNGLRDEEEDDIPSDVYYACLHGNYNYDCDDHFGECADRNDAAQIDEADLYSEVSVGRACVDSEEEVSNFVIKTLQHAQGGGEYLSKILYIGEDLIYPEFYTQWGGDYKDVMESYIPSYYTLEKLYDRDDPNNNWNPLELIERLGNDPVQFINHMGHGSHYYILKVSGNEIKTLTNEKHFFIYSQSCYTGSFDNKLPWSGYVEYDCIAELLTTELEYGAYACILNARFGLGSEDSIDSPSGALDESFIKAIFSENIRGLGPANHYSKEDNVWRIDENGLRWCYYQTNLFGDPHLSIKDPNLPPNKPTIDGPTKVKVGTTHNYTISTIDPESDDLYYHVDIGDGGKWYGPYHSGEELKISVTFPKKGYVTISARSRDIDDALSETATLTIQVPRNRAFSNNYQLGILGHFQRLLPVISRFLRL